MAALSVHACATTTAVPTPTAPVSRSPDAVWQRVDGFLPAGTSLSAIAVRGSDGFVIAGSSESATADCPSQREAHIWTSSDGLIWSEQGVDMPSNATLGVLPTGGQGWPAIGSTGSPGCAGTGPVAWSPDDNWDWHRSATSGLDPADEIVDMVAIPDSFDFVTSGHFADESDAMGVWTMQLDGFSSRWQRAASPPPAVGQATLTSLAGNGSVVVGFDLQRDPHAWYSLDRGDTWTNSNFSRTYGFQATDSDAGADGFVAGARACCALPDQRVGVVVRSDDGQGWAEARPGLFLAKPIEAVVSTEAGWIGLGEETTWPPMD